MINLSETKSFSCGKEAIFEIIEDIRKLGLIKKEMKNLSVAREEPGLQIVDTEMIFFPLKIRSRLQYTTRPERYTELKQIKGLFKQYLCEYTITDTGLKSDLRISLKIKLPFFPLGFIISQLYKPICKLRLYREFSVIGKMIKQQKGNV